MKRLHALLLSAVLPMILAACSGDDDDAPASTAGSSGTAGSGAPGSGGAGATAGAASGGAAAGESTSAGGGGSTGASPCEQGCEATLAADCSNGPATHAKCVEDCEALSDGPCAVEYGALQACADGETVTCGASGIPVVEACPDEQAAFIACLN